MVNTEYKAPLPFQSLEALEFYGEYTLPSQLFDIAHKKDQEVVKKGWKERTITYLNQLEVRLDEAMPNFTFQNKADQIGHFLKAKFSPLKKFNEWLDSNGQGEWYTQLATFLAKLPARAVRNIVNLLYRIIESIMFSAVHPLKSLINLSKLLLLLVDELTKPETWSKMGIGMVGTSLGQATTGNPYSVIGLGIGGAMAICGLTVGPLQAAILAEKGKRAKAAKQNLFFQAKQIPETALTGFCMGLIIGGIQRALQKSYVVSDHQEATRHADQFIKDHNLPSYTKVELDPSGNMRIIWERQFFHPGPRGVTVTVSQGHLILQPNLAPLIEAYGMNVEPYLPGINFKWTYPTSPANVLLSKYASVVGATAAFDSTFKN